MHYDMLDGYISTDPVLQISAMFSNFDMYLGSLDS